MRLTRQEDISLYLYLKDRIIMPEYAELAEGYSLTSSDGATWEMEYSSEIGIHPFRRGDYTGEGRGLVYFDLVNNVCNFGSEQTDRIVVRDSGGSIIDSSLYVVNYLNGELLTSENLTGGTIDYYWNYVAVIDAWPYENVVAMPIVSINLLSGDKAPLQLGGGSIREAEWNVQIFANSKGERDDLMDVIYDGIYRKRCPIYTYATGLPLKYNGMFNYAFTTETNLSFPSLFFENVEKRLSGLPSWGFYETERLNRYRAEITFDTLAYQQG